MTAPARPFNASCRQVVVASLLASFLAGCGQQAKPAAPSAPTVTAGPVVVRQVRQWDEFNGRIEAMETVQVRPHVSGFIEQVNFTEGGLVKKGDVLLRIDARPYRAELARTTAQLARARTQVVLARSEAERARKLVEAKAMSTELLEQRRAAADQAQADVQAAQAAVDQARLNLNWTEVRAPIDGRVGRALITAGNLISTGEGSNVLTTLVSQNQVYVYFDADETTFRRYTRMLKGSAKLPVRVALVGEEGYSHSGNVDFVDNQLTRSTGSISLRAVLDNRDGQFTPGLYARVKMVGSGEFQAVLIDDKAVLTDQDRKYVYVVDQEGKAQRRDITLGGEADGLRIVKSGLADGDRVIVDGVQKVLVSGTAVDARPVVMAKAEQIPQQTAALN